MWARCTGSTSSELSGSRRHLGSVDGRLNSSRQGFKVGTVVGEVERNVVLGHGDILVNPSVNPASAGCVLVPPRSVWRVGDGGGLQISELLHRGTDNKFCEVMVSVVIFQLPSGVCKHHHCIFEMRQRSISRPAP